jgi:hypothetical protein
MTRGESILRSWSRPQTLHGTCHRRMRALVVALMLMLMTQPARPQDSLNGFERCRLIADDVMRLRCYENAAAAFGQHSTSASEAIGNWRLIRTPNPQGGADAISILRIASLTQSDPNLAGLMVRCAKDDVDVLLVLIEPLPPRARPTVSIRAGGKDLRFEASVVPPGALILLPHQAAALASGPWQSLPELNLDVVYEQKATRGVIQVDGLRPALDRLRRSCPSG